MRLPLASAKALAEADHRRIGHAQDLFFFHKLSKGSCFFKPRGAHIYNRLLEYLRAEYRSRHYEEVITPNVFDCRLWQTSGHWQHYKQNMITFQLGEHHFGLKPMNCPSHCLMFKQQQQPVKEHQLPLRWADFGALHRNEYSGSLHGLTRLTRFQQDDAHIFCTRAQVEPEVAGCLEFADCVYKQFGFTYQVALSLRPKSFLGEPALWDEAEQALRRALISRQLDFKEQACEGAFYGPKIDIVLKDCNQRAQQCATIQLDFQLPQQFDLVYERASSEQHQHQQPGQPRDKLERPVIIHRAILGSIERFIAMLAEHTAGRWPFWLSPLQALVVPIKCELDPYAQAVKQRLSSEGFMVDACQPGDHMTLKRRILEAHKLKYNFILVVGDREAATGSVMARSVSNGKTHQALISVDALAKQFAEFQRKRLKCVEGALLESG